MNLWAYYTILESFRKKSLARSNKMFKYVDKLSLFLRVFSAKKGESSIPLKKAAMAIYPVELNFPWAY